MFANLLLLQLVCCVENFFLFSPLFMDFFFRADKSEGLNHEELQLADQRVEYLRGALTAISRKLPPVGMPQIENAEKRMVFIRKMVA